MLILRGLSALFVGLTVVIQAAPLDAEPATRLRLPQVQPTGTSVLGANGEGWLGRLGGRNQRHASTPPHFLRVPHRDTLYRRRHPARRRLFSRQDDCSSSTTLCSAGANGTEIACDGCSTCCPGASGGFQCCQQGFKCCTSETGTGACCPDDGTSPPQPGVADPTSTETVTRTHTVTSFTGGQTIGMYLPSLMNGEESFLVHKEY